MRATKSQPSARASENLGILPDDVLIAAEVIHLHAARLRLSRFVNFRTPMEARM